MNVSNHGLGPDFICVGAQKGGTQWLYDQLVFHPDFWMPPIKELHYFDRAIRRRGPMHEPKLGRSLDELNRARSTDGRPMLDARGMRFIASYVALAKEDNIDLEAYAHLFDDKGKQISGDITGGYSSLRAGLIARIMQRFPNLKVVFIARDPVERVWSQLSMRARRDPSDQRTRGPTVRNIPAPDPEPVTPASIHAHLEKRGVATRSYPSQIVERWRRSVPDQQFGLFFFDDLRTKAAALRRSIISFLGGNPTLGSGTFEAGYNRKSGQDKLVMTDDMREALIRHFADEIRTCAQVLGGPAKEWPARYGL